MLFAAGAAKASNYPSDYTYQKARVVSKGPAVIASVSSGIMDKFAVAYKSSGILGGSGSIQAVVRVTGVNRYSGYSQTVERVVNMAKERNGAGFMAAEMGIYDFIPQGFPWYVKKIEVAFFSGQQWDSDYGANYAVEKGELEAGAAFKSEHSGGPNIEGDCWNFIVGEMRK